MLDRRTSSSISKITCTSSSQYSHSQPIARLTVHRTLKEFVYVDETGKDVGANVRQKAKDITNLLQDEDRLRSERRSRGDMRDRMLGNLAESGLKGEGDYGAPRSPPPRNAAA